MHNWNLLEVGVSFLLEHFYGFRDAPLTVSVSDLLNAETIISTSQASTCVLVNATNTAQNATTVTSFSESSSGNPIIHGNATSPSIMTPMAAYLYPTDAKFTNTTSHRSYNTNCGSLYQ